jgi:diguanylate cyclase (GGDEF)-like protein
LKRRGGSRAARALEVLGWLEWSIVGGAIVVCALGLSTASAGWLLALGLATTAVMVLAARGRGRALRSAWYALACAAALFTIADLLAIRDQRVSSRVFVALHLPGYLLTGISFWRMIAAGPVRRRGVADLAVLAVGLLLLLLRLVFGGGVRTEQWDDALRMVFPLADLILLVLSVRLVSVWAAASTRLLASGVVFLLALSVVMGFVGYADASQAVIVLQTGFLTCWALAPMTPAVRPAGSSALLPVIAGMPFWPLAAVVLLAPVALLVHGSVVGDGRSVAIAVACGITALFVLARLNLEARLGHLHDPVTGLANLRGLHDAAATAFASADGRTVAVYFFDVMAFHTINDMYGTPAGDRVLSTLAERAEADAGPTGTAARLNADSFAVIKTLADQSQVEERAARLQHAIALPVDVDSRSISLSSYIGIATSRYAAGADELLRNADLALHAAKLYGAGQIVRYGPALLAALVEPARLRGELPAAVRGGQLFLEYQPIVELATDRIHGFEALVRWQHPELGRLGPDRFIPVAESAGGIDELGAEVLRQALRGTAYLNQVANRPIFVDVNVSPHQLAHADGLIAALKAGLIETRLDPSLVVIELTETGLGTTEALAETVLNRLSQTGVRLAVDDFGTGYSSLSRLRDLPIDIVKIDKSFVTDLREGPPLDLITGIVDIARSMGLTIVAEGVETAEVKDLLVDAGCRYGQGYFYSEPVALETASDRLR